MATMNKMCSCVCGVCGGGCDGHGIRSGGCTNAIVVNNERVTDNTVLCNVGRAVSRDTYSNR